MTANDAKLYLTDLWESDWTSVDETIALEMAIKALTAIEDIKAEIKQWYWQEDKQALAKDPCVVDAMVDLFIRTINKHI